MGTILRCGALLPLLVLVLLTSSLTQITAAKAALGDHVIMGTNVTESEFHGQEEGEKEGGRGGLQTEETFLDRDGHLVVRDEKHPLVTVMNTAPHSMSLLIKPWDYREDTMVRLLYERVSMQKQPIMQHLDDPVIEYIKLIRRSQFYKLSELPMGKYIVCGEALHQAEIYQSSCFEIVIDRLDTNTLQGGVKMLILLSMVLVTAVIVYAILYRVCKLRTQKKESDLPMMDVPRVQPVL